jgi:formate-dependent phosphoribosylglycinamide formyltransferase (GAR transformylase)
MTCAPRVTASTRAAGRESLRQAAVHPLRIDVATYDFADARTALHDVAGDQVRHVAVLNMWGQG